MDKNTRNLTEHKMLNKPLFIALGFTCLLSLTGCNQVKMQSANLDRQVYSGESQQSVIAKLGQPIDVQIYKNNTVLVFCDEVFIINNLLHVWLRDGKVVQTKKSSNDEIGTCLDNNSQVNWAATTSIDSLVLGNPSQNRSSSSAVADVLRNSMERDNQIYNSLINNMGAQQRALQPQRLQTNCMWIGNMLNCN